jgi:hypothetical protein
MAIVDQLDKIASIVAGICAVLTFVATKKQDQDEVAGSGRRRLTYLAAAFALACVVLATIAVVRTDRDPKTVPQPTPVVSSTPVASPPAGVDPRPGDLRPGSEVPQQFRDAITKAAYGCGRPGVTPALIAAMLYAESGFDPGKKSPDGSEVGIAMWTPELFTNWVPDSPGHVATPEDPLDSIAAMGPFLCELSRTVGYLRPGDPRLLIAAGYRVGGKAVRNAGGIPDSASAYTDVVRQKLLEYGY